MARASDARIAKGEAGPLEGLPLGIKDLYATKGVHTQACSHILDGFKPPYESTVTAQLWRDGAVMLGKLNMDEFAMGSSNETSYYGPVASPWLPPNWSAAQGARGARRRQARPAGARRLLGRLGFGGRGAAVPRRDRERHRRLDPPARRLHRHCRHQADLWPLLALRHGRLRLVARSGRTDRARLCATRRSCCARWRATTPRIRPAYDAPVPDYEAAVGRSVKGLKIGIPKEYRLDGMTAEIETLWAQGVEWLRAAGASIVDISLPHTRYALARLLYRRAGGGLVQSRPLRRRALRPARAGDDIADLYEKTRAAGFGAEVRRRVMIGTYVLSAGYYDAYYVRAQKIRTLIKRDFETVFADGVDAILTPATPSAAFGIGEKGSADPVEMYLNDVFTVTVNMAGLPGLVAPAGLSAEGLPLGSAIDRPAVRRGDVVRARRGDRAVGGTHGAAATHGGRRPNGARSRRVKFWSPATKASACPRRRSIPNSSRARRATGRSSSGSKSTRR